MKNFFKINTKMLMRYLHVQNVDAVLGAWNEKVMLAKTWIGTCRNTLGRARQLSLEKFKIWG
jgi:hypothetical protein